MKDSPARNSECGIQNAGFEIAPETGIVCIVHCAFCLAGGVVSIVGRDGAMGRTRSLSVLFLLLIAGQAAAQQAQAPAPPPTFSTGGWGFTIGGRIKLDMIHDFDAITSTDSFDPRTIVVPDTPGANTRIHARETRVSLGIAGPANGRELKMFVEGDFYGTG